MEPQNFRKDGSLRFGEMGVPLIGTQFFRKNWSLEIRNNGSAPSQFHIVLWLSFCHHHRYLV